MGCHPSNLAVLPSVMVIVSQLSVIDFRTRIGGLRGHKLSGSFII